VRGSRRAPGGFSLHGRLVNSLKGLSSRRLRQEFPDLVPRYWRAQRLWSGSYFARCSAARR